MSQQYQGNFSNEIFEKFFIKFNNLSADIEGLQKTYPQLIPAQVIEKLNLLKRDTGFLTQELKKIDSKASDKILQLESKCDSLNTEIMRLKDEVENLVNINSELHAKLGDGTGNKSFLDITPKSSTDKINYSQFQASEDKVSSLRKELIETRQNYETEKTEKKHYFAQVEWLRNNLEDNIKKYNDVLQEKLHLQDILAEQLKEGELGSDMGMQLKKYKEKEVVVCN